MKRIIIIFTLMSIHPVMTHAQDSKGYITTEKSYADLIGASAGKTYGKIEVYVVSYGDYNEDLFITREIDQTYYILDISSSPLQDICIKNRLHSSSDRCDRLMRTSLKDDTDCIIGVISSHLNDPFNDMYVCYVYFFPDEAVIIPRFKSAESYFFEHPIEMVSIFIRFAKKNNIGDIKIKEYVLDLLSKFSGDNDIAYHSGVYEYDGYSDENLPASTDFLRNNFILGASNEYIMESFRKFIDYAKQQYSNRPKGRRDRKIISELVRIMAIANKPSVRERSWYKISEWQSFKQRNPEYYYDIVEPQWRKEMISRDNMKMTEKYLQSMKEYHNNR